MDHQGVKDTYYVEQSLQEFEDGKGMMCRAYLVSYEIRKIAEVWMSGTIKQFYDKGNPSSQHGIPTHVLSTSAWAVAYLVLRDAFDEKTAYDWYTRIDLMPSGYVKTANTKADLFADILAAQRVVPGIIRVKA